MGLSGKEIVKRLRDIGVHPESIQALLVSHEHQDHTRGAGVLSRQLDIPIMATEGTWDGLEKSVGSIAPRNRKIIKDSFDLGGVMVDVFPLPHDAIEPVGFIIHCDGICIGMATDVGCVQEEMVNQLKRCQLVILEANHDLELLKYGPYPMRLKKRIMGPMGHLSNDDAGYVATLLVEAGVSHLILGHLSQENNHPRLAYHTVKNTLEANDILVGKDLSLSLVEHQEMGRMVKVG